MAGVDEVYVGFKKETTYGTPVVVDRFLPILPNTDSLDMQPIVAESQGLRSGGRVARASSSVIVGYEGGGGWGMELQTKGMGTLFEACMGAGVSTLVGGTTYQQNFTLGSSPLPLTIQKVARLLDGTAAPQTYTGAVCRSLAISVDNNAIATVTPDFDCRAMATATAAASASYASGAATYHSLHAAITIGGTVTAPTTTALATGGTAVANVSAWNMTLDQALSSSPVKFGAAGLKSQPKGSKPVPSGTMTIEYDSNTIRDAIIARTTLGMVLTLTTTEALSTGFAQFSVYLPAIKLSGPMPQATGEVVQQSVNWTAYWDETNEPVVISLRTADSSL